MELPGFSDDLNIFENSPNQQFRTIEMTINGVTKKIVIPVTAGSDICIPGPPPLPVQSPSIDSTQLKPPRKTSQMVPIKIEPEDDNGDLCEISDVTSLQPFMSDLTPNSNQDELVSRKGRPPKNPAGVQRLPNILKNAARSHSEKPTLQTRGRGRGWPCAPPAHQPIAIRPSSEAKEVAVTPEVKAVPGPTSSSSLPKGLLEPNVLQSIVQTLTDKNMLHSQTKLVVVNNSGCFPVPANPQFKIVTNNDPTNSRVQWTTFDPCSVAKAAPLVTQYFKPGINTAPISSPPASVTKPPSLTNNPNTVFSSQSFPLVINSNCNTTGARIVSPLQTNDMMSPPQPIQAMLTANGNLAIQSTQLVAGSSSIMKPAVVSQPQLAQIVNGNVMVTAATVMNTVPTSTVSSIRPVYMLPLPNAANCVNSVPVTQRMSVPIVPPMKNVSSPSLQPIHMMQLPNGKLQVIQPGSVNNMMNQSNTRELQTTCLQATRNVDGSVVFQEVPTPANPIHSSNVPTTVHELGNLSSVNPPSSNTTPTSMTSSANMCMKQNTTTNSKRQIILNGHSLGPVVQSGVVFKEAQKKVRVIPRTRSAVGSFNPQKILKSLPTIAPKLGSSSDVLRNLAKAISGYEACKERKIPKYVAKAQKKVSSSDSVSDSSGGSDLSLQVAPEVVDVAYTPTKTLDDRWAEVMGETPGTQTVKELHTKPCSVVLRSLDMRGRHSINVHDVIFKIPTKAKPTKRKYELVSDISESSQSDDDTEDDDYFEALKKEQYRKRQQAKRMAMYQKKRQKLESDEELDYI